MTKSKGEQQELLLTELLHDVNNLKTAVQVLQEKQGTQAQRHESFKAYFSKLESRLHGLENFMLASVQRLSFIKTLFKFWPVLVAVLVLCFSVGVVVDDKAVATKLVNTVEDKPHELL